MGWLARLGGWAFAHRREIVTALSVLKSLRARRKANQKPDENAKDYYRRVAKHEGVAIVTEVLKGTDPDAENALELNFVDSEVPE